MKPKIAALLFLMTLAACAPISTSVPVPTVTSTPAVPTTASTPEKSATVQPQQPPACTFPLAQISTEESQPEEYTFSEPKVVLNAQDNLYDIVEWLPDNQRVLVAQDLYESREEDKLLQQSIEVYDPETGDSKVYAIRYHITDLPSWQPKLNAVVYPAINFLGFEGNENKIQFTQQIWVSYGQPNSVQILSDNSPQFPFAIKPDGSEMIYLSDKKVSKLNTFLKDIPSISFDPIKWDYAEDRKNDIPLSYQMAWQPNTALVFLYGDGVHRFDGYTFILNTDNGQVCELDMGGWAIKARWSSNGRYLAIIRTQEHFPISLSDLAILDTLTGTVYIVHVTPEKGEGNYYVKDIVWGPDNLHILAIGSFTNQTDNNQSGLYLIDFLSGKSDSILPTHTFYAASSKGNLAWSPDGSKVLIRCPTVKDEQICFIKVQKTNQ